MTLHLSHVKVFLMGINHCIGYYAAAVVRTCLTARKCQVRIPRAFSMWALRVLPCIFVGSFRIRGKVWKEKLVGVNVGVCTFALPGARGVVVNIIFPWINFVMGGNHPIRVEFWKYSQSLDHEVYKSSLGHFVLWHKCQHTPPNRQRKS